MKHIQCISTCRRPGKAVLGMQVTLASFMQLLQAASSLISVLAAAQALFGGKEGPDTNEGEMV